MCETMSVQSVHCSLLVTPASNRGWPAEAVRELQELFGESEIAILTVVKVPLSVAKGTLVRKRDGELFVSLAFVIACESGFKMVSLV